MKYVLPALVAVVCALAACETTADHRDLYAPNKPSGPYTAKLRSWTLAGRDNHQSTTYSFPITQAGPMPAADSGPVAPPPPPPPTTTPDINAGAPAATPMPLMPPGAAATPAAPVGVPDTSMPAATPAGSTAAPPPVPGATPAAGGAATPAPAIPGLSQ